MFAFAGKDLTELPIEVMDGRAAYAQRKAERPERAYKLFLDGRDTLQVSQSFGIREATIERWITMERCRRHNLPSPYGRRS